MSRKTMLLAAAALAASLAGAPAAAQGTGWYIGGGPGAAQADFERADFVGLAGGSYSVDDSDVAPRVFGGYRVAPNWAVEFGFAAFGRFKHRYAGGTGNAVYHYDASALTVGMNANLPLAGGVSLNGRLGAAFTAANLRLASESGTITTNPPVCENSWWYDDCTSTKTNFFWGLGAQFDLNPRWGIRLDYDNYGEVGEQFETGRADIEQWSLNVLFRF